MTCRRFHERRDLMQARRSDGRPLIVVKTVAWQVAPEAAGAQIMAPIAARISVLRDRPPGVALAISGSSRTHSASFRSLGNDPSFRQ